MTTKRWLLLGSFTLSLLVLAYEWLTVPLSSWFYLDLTQCYGFISLGFLFAALFPGPFYRLFPNAPFAIAHRAYLAGLGISTFYFALLHALIGFFVLLEGFAAFFYLPGAYFWGMVFGMLALFLLALLAGTSFDYARQKMGPHWKRLHQFVYLAGFLTAAHVVMAGSHFPNLQNFIPTFWLALFLVLVILHALATNRRLSARYPQFSLFFFPVVIMLCMLAGILVLYGLYVYAHGLHH